MLALASIARSAVSMAPARALGQVEDCLAPLRATILSGVLAAACADEAAPALAAASAQISHPSHLPVFPSFSN